jgi:protein CpxP
MRRIVLGFSLAALAVGGAAWAQPSLPGGASGGSQQAVSAELIRLHDDLHLSPSQEQDWRQYAIAIAPSRNVLARHQATTELLPMVPTPRRIALIEATMAQDALDFRRQGDAVTAFYARLTPEQQRTFDRETLPQDNDPRP